LREFNSLEEDWPLDYVTLNQQPDQPRHVMVAAVRPHLVQEVLQVCEASGLKPLRLAMRCCTGASLLKDRQRTATVGAQLLVDIAGEEVDLAVYDQQQVVFIRQTRLSGDALVDAAAQSILVAELRRTMAAAQNRPCGVPVRSVVLWSAGAGSPALAELLAEQLALPVSVLDPFEGAAREFSEVPGRFAPLVGLLRDEFAGESPALDFLHPRRCAEPPSRRKMYVLAGVAAALVLFVVVLNNWLGNRELTQRVQRLQKQSKELLLKSQQANEVVAAAQKIDDWVGAERNWLDELEWLSSHLPPAENAVLTHLNFNHKQSGGEIVLEGLARDVEAVTRLEGGLSDASHRPAPKSTNATGSKPPYAIRFTSSLSLGAKEQ
jgi:Tfp pilus assembly protein PilN